MLGRERRGLSSSPSARLFSFCFGKPTFLLAQEDVEEGANACSAWNGSARETGVLDSGSQPCNLFLSCMVPSPQMLMSGALRPSLFIPLGAVGLQVILLRHRYTALEFEWREIVELLPSASQKQLAIQPCTFLVLDLPSTCEGTLGHMWPLSWIAFGPYSYEL